MRVRTFLGILLALVAVVAVSYLSNQNSELLTARFRLTQSTTVPVYAAVLAVFLLGFLPAVSVLLTQTLKRELARRRERKLDREARSLRSSFRRAVDLRADGQWGRAAAELEGFLAGKPEDFSTLLLYGEVLRRQGRTDQALEVHRRASVLYPQSVAVLYQMAEDYEAAGEVEVAREIQDRILRDFPGQGLQVLRRRRNAALGRRDWREAALQQERIEAMLAESGESVEMEKRGGVRRGLTYQKGVDLLEGERVEEARKIFSEILAEDREFIPAAIMLGEAALLEGDGAAALDCWRKGFEDTGSPVFLQRIEDHFIEQEQPLEGIETLHALIASAENDLLPRFYLGRLYHRLEMHDEAFKVLAGLQEEVESSPGFRLLLARIHQRRGEMGKAVQALLACARDAGITANEYICQICRDKYSEWQDRCDACGTWNSIELAFSEARPGGEGPGARQARVLEIHHGQFDRRKRGERR